MDSWCCNAIVGQFSMISRGQELTWINSNSCTLFLFIWFSRFAAQQYTCVRSSATWMNNIFRYISDLVQFRYQNTFGPSVFTPQREDSQLPWKNLCYEIVGFFCSQNFSPKFYERHLTNAQFHLQIKQTRGNTSAFALSKHFVNNCTHHRLQIICVPIHRSRVPTCMCLSKPIYKWIASAKSYS